MKIENQVCSLELSKQLKELGVPQTAYWTWYTNAGTGHLIHNPDGYRGFENKSFDAFTVAELGELLPSGRIAFAKVKLVGQRDDWEVEYYSDGGNIKAFIRSETEADARAKCFIHLLENNLINIEK